MFRTLFAHLECDVFDHFGESRTSYDNKVHTIDLPGRSQSFGGKILDPFLHEILYLRLEGGVLSDSLLDSTPHVAYIAQEHADIL